ncbi:hypothetical protein [Streptomyces sp. NA13]|uniref:hypothetical protein n=1 Tax=Streptomyces sp. NA13 TaxID=2996051 RepID=UPI0022712DD9|nr:hypothetical protein [Streptomyces sp. NA13]WAC96771.1 hypothetical protein OSU72_11660 [Streptomyces sp. NA13]
MSLLRREKRPPVEPADWRDVTTFTIGSTERPPTKGYRRPVDGPTAIRVTDEDAYGPILRPCAYLGFPQNNTGGPDIAHTLFTDPLHAHLLCSVSHRHEKDGIGHHVVRTAEGTRIGVIQRLPRKGLRRHTWRIEQPGRPVVVGRSRWAAYSPRHFAGEAGISLANVALDSVLPGEGKDTAAPRRLTWTADDELVMETQDRHPTHLHADWLDRRLAFAFALIGDKDPIAL